MSALRWALLLYHIVIWSRYIRLLLDLLQFYGYSRLKSVQEVAGHPVPSRDKFTVISCTLGDQDDYISNIRSWLVCDPGAIIIASPIKQLEAMRDLVKATGHSRIRLCPMKDASYRNSASECIRKTKTPFHVLVDDDVRWSPKTLQRIAIAMSDPAVGGVNTIQRVCPSGSRFTVWEMFGALNLVRRNILHSFVAYFADGHILNLSGRTAAYRTSIVQCEEFYTAFLNDYWRGRYHIRTGDDNFATSWVVQRGWKTRLVNDSDALIITTVNADKTYLKQLMRWSRDTARSYLRDAIFAIGHGNGSFRVYCVLKIVANYASDLALAIEVAMLLSLTALRGYPTNVNGETIQLPPSMRIWAEHVIAMASFQIFEHAPFFWPLHNLWHIPGAVLYAYMHSIAVLWAMCTLNESVWGSRPSAVA